MLHQQIYIIKIYERSVWVFFHFIRRFTKVWGALAEHYGAGRKRCSADMRGGQFTDLQGNARHILISVLYNYKHTFLVQTQKIHRNKNPLFSAHSDKAILSL